MVGELKNKKQLIFELKEKEHNSQKTCCLASLSSSPKEKTQFHQQSSVSLSPDGSIKTSISRDECFKSSQTVETSFLPCEACSVAQESLRQTGKVVLQLFKDLNLPSRLSRHMSNFDSTKWMTTNEVMQWTAEQNKDLSVFCKHFEGTIQTLKASVESLEKRCCALENQKKVLEKKNSLERETQEIFQKQSSSKLQDLIKSHQIAMNEITKEKGNLESQMKNLNEKFEQSQDELQKAKDTNKRNKVEIQQLTEKLKTQTSIASELEQLKKQIQTLKIQLEDYEKRFLECSKELNQEQAKNKSMTKHFEAIHQKQCSTLDHVEKLNDENTDLQNQLAELQDSFDEKQEKIENLEKQKQQLQHQITVNEKKMEMNSFEKEELEKMMEEMKTQNNYLQEEIKKLEEKENLLIQYPDLNGPVLDESLCSGNVMHDMELQIKANILRIELLEKQNQTLRLTLKKMNERYELHLSNEEPVSLWNMNTSQTKIKGNYNREAEEPGKKCIQNHNVLVSKSTEKNFNADSFEKGSQKMKEGQISTAASLHNSSCLTAMRNNSALFRSKTANAIHKRPSLRDTEKVIGRMSKTSSIKTYISLKQQGKLHIDNPWGLRGKSQLTESELSSRASAPYLQTQVLSFACKRCDKMYLQAQELKIHSIYCKG